MSDPKHALSGYCLWLLPSAADATSLRELIASASELSGTPAFPAHITLLAPRGGVRNSASELEDALHRAIDATMLQRAVAGPTGGGERGTGGGLVVTLNPPQAGDRYYQSVLAAVEPSSAQGVVALRAAVAGETGENPLPYFPHLSLGYGELEQAKREEIALRVGMMGQWPREIRIDEAAVVDVTGGAEGWKVVSKFTID